MTVQKKVFIVGARELILRESIIDLIYEADWEIRGILSEHTKDITEHYMADEEEVLEAIIKAVRRAEEP